MQNSLYKLIFRNNNLPNYLYLATGIFVILYLFGDSIPYANKTTFLLLIVVTFGFIIVWEVMKEWLKHVEKKNDESLVSAWEMISKREFDKARQKLSNTECLDHYKHRQIFLEALIDYHQSEFRNSLAKLESIEKPDLLSDPFLTSFYEHKGYNLKELKRYEEAIEAFNLSLEGKDDIISDHFIIYQHRGNCNHRLKRFDKAISDYDKSIQLKPIADTYHNKALSLFALNELQSALEYFDRAIELNNRESAFYYNRMQLHVQMKKWDTAIQDAEVLLSRNEYTDSAYFHRGLAKCHIGSREDGLKDLSLIEDEVLNIRAQKQIDNINFKNLP